MDKAANKSPTKAPLAMVVAGRFFHAEFMECPEGAGASQRRSIAALAVEESAPLPLEQLAFGLSGSGTRMAAWAAVRKRIESALPVGAFASRHVLPEPALPLPDAPKDFVGWRWLAATEGSLVALKFSGAQIAPVALRAFSLSQEADDRSLLALRKQLATGMADAPHENGLWRLEGFETAPKGALKLRWRTLTCEEWSQTTGFSEMGAVDLDLADLRPAEAVDAVRREAAARARLRQSYLALGAFAALLLLLQIIVWSLQGMAAWRESELAESRPAADKAEADATLLETLDRVTARRLPALERLAALNASRPDGVTLSRAAFTEEDTRISGRATSMGELNAWIGALRKDKAVKAVETARVHAASDSATFELRLVAAQGGAR